MRMKKTIPKYTVIKDTREKEGYHFKEYDQCSGMVVETMKTGDYTVKGLEDVLCVERKASVAEISNNLGRKKSAFIAEMDRMKSFEHSFMVLEFSMTDVLEFPKGSNIPISKQRQTRITGKYILKSLLEFQINYGINIIFCDSKYNAFLVTNSIFKRLNEHFNTIFKVDYE
jgi:hypothetical protein